MQQPGLYFPFIHIRDESWLKAAALYWPSIRRLVPSGYRKRDGSTARTFFEAGILRDESPSHLLAGASWRLAEELQQNARVLSRNYSIRRALANWDGRQWSLSNDSAFESPHLGWIHVSKFPTAAVELLTSMGLAQVGRFSNRRPRSTGLDHETWPDDWVGLHPVLAGAYMTALAGQLSRETGMQPLTDQTDLRVATASDDIGTALRLIVGRQAEDEPNPPGVDTYVMLALQQVLPLGLDEIPAEKIIECREKLGEELAAFRSYVASQQSELAELVAIPHDRLRHEAFTDHVAETVERPLRRLEKGLKLLHLEPTRSLLLAGTFTPPLAVQQTLDHLNAPPAIATAAAVTTAFGSAWWQVQIARRSAKEGSPVAYLLDARERLTSRTLVNRVRKMFLGTYGSKVKRTE